MKRQNERRAVVDHEEAMERAVAEMLLDARQELSRNQDGTDLEHRAGAEAQVSISAQSRRR